MLEIYIIVKNDKSQVKYFNDLILYSRIIEIPNSISCSLLTNKLLDGKRFLIYTKIFRKW